MSNAMEKLEAENSRGKIPSKTKVALACVASTVLVVSGFIAASRHKQSDDYIEPDSIPMLIRDRLQLKNAASQISDTGYRIRTRNLIVDAAKVDADQTIEDVYSGTDEESVDRILFQSESLSSVYDYGDDHSYVVFFDGGNYNGAIEKTQDAVFARNNTRGEMVDGVTYDYDNGVAFIPKYLYDEVDAELSSGASQTYQMQVMSRYEYAQDEFEQGMLLIPVDIKTIGAEAKKMVEVQSIGNQIAIPLADKDKTGMFIDKSISVDINDGAIVLNTKDNQYSIGTNEPSLYYDDQTGALNIYNVAPIQVVNVNVEIDTFEEVTMETFSALATAGTISNPKAECYNIGHWGVANCWGGYGTDGAATKTIQRFAPGGYVWSFWDIGANQMSNNTCAYVITLGGCPSKLGSGWSVDGGKRWHADCIHAFYPNGTANPPSGGYFKVISANRSSQTITVAFFVTCVASQEGAVVVTLNAPRNGTIDLWKKSNPNPALGISINSTVANAKFGVYGSLSDAQNKRNPVGIMSTDASGHSRYEFQQGVYYVREIEVPWPWLVSDEIKTINLKAGKEEKITFQEDSSALIRVKKVVKPAAGDTTQQEMKGVNKVYGDVTTTVDNGGTTVTTTFKARTDIPSMKVFSARLACVTEPTCTDTRYNSSTKMVSNIVDGDVLTFKQSFVTNAGWSATDTKASIITMQVDGITTTTGLPMLAANLEGTKYGVYSDANCANLLGEVTLDAKGEGTYGAQLGQTLQSYTKYWLKETKAVNGYALDPIAHEATTSRNALITSTVSDSFSVLKISKRSQYSQYTSKIKQFTLAGARYGVFSSVDLAKTHNENNVVTMANNQKGVLVTDANGNSQTLALGSGKYYIAELPSAITRPWSAGSTQPLYGSAVENNGLAIPVSGQLGSVPLGKFLLDETIYPVDMKSGETTVVVSNENIPVRIKIDKQTTRPDVVNLAQFTLEGAVFGVYDSEAKARAAAVGEYRDVNYHMDTSDAVAVIWGKADGTSIATKELPLRDYWIKEIRTPKNYNAENGSYWNLGDRTETNAILKISVGDFLASDTYADGILVTPSVSTKVNTPKNVSVKIKKEASEVDSSMLNEHDAMNLANAKFALYKTVEDAELDVNRLSFNVSDGNEPNLITTYADGTSNMALELSPAEYYYAREIEPPHVHSNDPAQDAKNIEESMYIVDPVPVKATYEDGYEAVLTAHKNNKVKPVKLTVKKFVKSLDNDGHDLHIQENPKYGDDSLEGALFAIFDSKDKALACPTTTDVNDFSIKDRAFVAGAMHVVQSKSGGECETIEGKLPWRKDGYFVREIKAPTSGCYELNDAVLQAGCDKNTEDDSVFDTVINQEFVDVTLGVDEWPNYYYVKIEKVTDTPSVLSDKLNYSLEGIHFGIYATEQEARDATGANPGRPLYNIYTRAVVRNGVTHYEAITGVTGPGTFYAKELDDIQPLGFQILKEPIPVEAHIGGAPVYDVTPIVPEYGAFSVPLKSKTAWDIDNPSQVANVESYFAQEENIYDEQVIIDNEEQPEIDNEMSKNPADEIQQDNASLTDNINVSDVLQEDFSNADESSVKPSINIPGESLYKAYKLTELYQLESEMPVKRTIVPYTIKFIPNGATSGVMEDVVVNKLLKTDTEFILPKNTYTREGYEFAGWSPVLSSQSGMNPILIPDEQHMTNLSYEDHFAANYMWGVNKEDFSKVTLTSFKNNIDDLADAVIILKAMWKNTNTGEILDDPYAPQMSVMNSSRGGRPLYRANKGGDCDISSYNGAWDSGYGNVIVLMTSPSMSNTAIYTAYNPNGNKHMYTIDWDEREYLEGVGWDCYFNAGMYADDNNGTPIYRRYNSSSGDHWFGYVNEKTTWKDEGIAWYGVKEWTMAYNGNGATGGSTASQTFQKGYTDYISSNGFTRTGYKFTGWNTAANGSGTSYSVGQSINDIASVSAGGTLTLYAQWTADTYTVKYSVPDPQSSISPAIYGSAPANQTPQINVAFTVSNCNSYKVGWKFSHWKYTDKWGNTQTVNAGASLTNIANAGSTVTLTAVFTENKYYVKFNSGLSAWRVEPSVNNGYAEGYRQQLNIDNYSGDGLTTANLLACQYKHNKFKFQYWKDGSGKKYNNQQAVVNLSTTNGAQVVLTGVWTPNIDYGVDCEANVISNHPKTGLTVQKTLTNTDNGIPQVARDLSGIVIGVYSNSVCTNLVKQGTTTAQGTVSFSGLVDGTTYYVKELSIPARLANCMTINDSAYPAVAGSSYAISIPNELTSMQITIKKQVGHNTKARISQELIEKHSPVNAAFAIYASQNDAINDTNRVKFINEDGQWADCIIAKTTMYAATEPTAYKAVVKGLENKDYWVKEIVLPNNGMNDWYSDGQPIFIDKNEGTNIEVVQNNELRDGSISVHKQIDRETIDTLPESLRSLLNNVCDGIIYGVYTDRTDALVRNDNYVSTITINDGAATVSGLPYGTYYVVEMSVPDSASKFGVTLSDEVHEVIVNEERDFAIYANDNLNTVSIQLRKEDGDSHTPIQGVIFDIYIDNDAFVCSTTPTNSEGIAVSKMPLLTNVQYRIVERMETAPPEYAGFGLVTVEPWETNITINKSDAIEPIVATNNIVEAFGAIDIRKQSNTGADATGAVFSVYSSNGQLYDTMTTEHGYARIDDVPVGTYTVVETKALPGHAFASDDENAATSYIGTVTPDGIWHVNNGEPIVNYQGYVKIHKQSSDNVVTAANPENYSLAGAVYAFYPIVDGKVSENPLEQMLITDQYGNTETITVPVGEYKVVELREPLNYSTPTENKEYTIEITTENSMQENEYVLETMDTPAYDLLEFSAVKHATETLDNGGFAQGTTSMRDTSFEVCYSPELAETVEEAIALDKTRTWVIQTDDNGRAELSSDYLVDGSDELFKNNEDETVLPVGTITVREVVPPVGYELGDAPVSAYRFLPDSAGYEQLGNTEEDMTRLPSSPQFSTSNNIYRADFSFFKKNGHDNRKMARFPFVLSLLDGDDNPIESHLVVTDENGYFSTSVGNNDNVNANDDWLPYNGENIYIPEGFAPVDSRVWFSGGTTAVEPSSDKGALVYGNYILTEVFRTDTDYYQLPEPIRFSVKYDERGAYVEMNGNRVQNGYIGDIVNHAIYVKSTNSRDAHTFTQVGTVNDSPAIIDVVNYGDATIGEEYSFMFYVYDRDTGMPITKIVRDVDDTNVEVQAGEVYHLTATDTQGSFEQRIELDGYDIAGKTLAIVTIAYHNNSIADIHNSNLSDNAETVTFPSIRTMAHDKETFDNIGLSNGRISIVDSVSYSNLLPGVKYQLRTVLMNKETELPVIDAHGQQVTVVHDFVPNEPGGVEDVLIAFDYPRNTKLDCVVFEKLVYDSVIVNTHENIDDELQSVIYPSVGTTAKDTSTGVPTGSTSGEYVEINDVVAYENLIPSKQYTLTGKIYIVDNNGAYHVADGSEKSITFIPDNSDGVVEISLTAKSDDVRGNRAVASEIIALDNEIVAKHDDPTSLPQTVGYPDVRTTATDMESEWKSGRWREPRQIVDVVKLSGLRPGITYRITGMLRDKATGEIIMNDSAAYSETLEFVAKKSYEEHSLIFTVPNTCDAENIVVTETLLVVTEEEDIPVAVHDDINDSDQTVNYPSISTVATEPDTSNHIGADDNDISVVDVITYKNLLPNYEYDMVGTLMNKATGEPVVDDAGNIVTAVTHFKPSTPNGEVEVTFVFEKSNVSGVVHVAFERLYIADSSVNDGKNSLIAEHIDIDDEGQSTFYPLLRTTATDMATNKHVGTASVGIKIQDIVKYENLVPNVEYVVEGTLMSFTTGQPIEKNGEPIRATATFTPEEANGEILLEFDVTEPITDGDKIVVFERLMYNGYQVGHHTDINDDNQTVYAPRIQTHASDAITNTHEGLAGKQVTIVDVVKYDNLLPDTEYVVTGKLVYKDGGTVVTNKDGKEVTATKNFTANASEGEVELEFKVNVDDIAGKSVVAYERLFDVENNLVAVHEDLNDEDQTVNYPLIETQASDIKTENHIGSADDSKIVDEVSFTNLTPGLNYVVRGTIMDKSTGKPVLDRNGNAISSDISFVPDDRNGKVLLSFDTSGVDVSGKTLVAFEELFEIVNEEERLIAEHKDINDDAQSVVYPNIVSTRALDSGGTKIVPDEPQVSIVDTVVYDNLIPGMEYTMRGTLMNGYEGAPLLENGTPIIAETKFVAEAASGTTTVEFVFDGSIVRQCDGVVFERIYSGDTACAFHEDLDDEEQTVYVTGVADDLINNGKHIGISDTSDAVGTVVIAAIAINVLLGLSVIIIRRRQGK